MESLRDIREAVGSDEFTNLLGNQMYKRLEKAYAGVPGAYNIYCDVGEVSDFKAQNIISISETTDLDRLLEGEEYREAPYSESAVSYRVFRYGKRLTIPWEMVQNDDISGINRMVDGIGRSARRSVAKFAVSLLESIPATTGVGALVEDTLAAAITAFSEQVDANGNKLGLTPELLIVPPALQFTADRLINSSLVIASDMAGTASAVRGDRNVLQGILTPVVEPFLTSDTTWYIGARPADMPGIELRFLRGYKDRPKMLRKKTDSSEEMDFDTDAYVYKVRHVFGGGVVNTKAIMRFTV